MKKLIMLGLVINRMNCNAMLAPTKKLAACAAAYTATVLAAKKTWHKHTNQTLVVPKIKVDKPRPQIKLD